MKETNTDVLRWRRAERPARRSRMARGMMPAVGEGTTVGSYNDESPSGPNSVYDFPDPVCPYANLGPERCNEGA